MSERWHKRSFGWKNIVLLGGILLGQSLYAPVSAMAQKSTPAIKITSPSAYTQTRQKTIPIQGTVIPDESERKSKVQVSLKELEPASDKCGAVIGEPVIVDVTEKKWSVAYNTQGIPDGNYCISATLQTYNITHSSAQLKPIKIDTTGPSITELTPANGSLLPSGLVTFTVFTNEDKETGSAYLAWSKEGVWKTDVHQPSSDPQTANRSTLPTPRLTINTNDYTDGEYELAVRVADDLGNRTEKSLTYSIDNTAPHLSTSLSPNQRISGVVPIELVTDELHPKSYDITVLDQHNNPLTVNGAIQGHRDDNASTRTFIYRWDTTKVPNGLYTLHS